MASKAFVRPTRPRFYPLLQKHILLVYTIIELIVSSSLEELNPPGISFFGSKCETRTVG